MKMNLSAAVLLMSLIPTISADHFPSTQAHIMGDYELCRKYWATGFGAAEMVAEAADPLAVQKLGANWVQGVYHTSWVSNNLDQLNAESTLLANIFPGNQFSPVLGPIPEPNVIYCGRPTTNDQDLKISTMAYAGGFSFFEFANVPDLRVQNAYTDVVRANDGVIAPFYESVITDANCTELAAAFSRAGTPVVTELPDGGPTNSLFIRTIVKRWEVVCGAPLPALPDPCTGRENIGTCGTISSLQQQVATLQAELAAQTATGGSR